MYPMQSEAHLYNGYTIEYIQANLHPAMHPVDIEHYMNNVKEVIRLQIGRISEPIIEDLKNSNHRLVAYYLGLEK